jgi:hypothetical protein
MALVVSVAVFSVIEKEEKFIPQSNNQIGGIIISVTRELTIFPNAPQIIIHIAISITLPFTANSLNSLSII